MITQVGKISGWKYSWKVKGHLHSIFCEELLHHVRILSNPELKSPLTARFGHLGKYL